MAADDIITTRRLSPEQLHIPNILPSSCAGASYEFVDTVASPPIVSPKQSSLLPLHDLAVAVEKTLPSTPPNHADSDTTPFLAPTLPPPLAPSTTSHGTNKVERQRSNVGHVPSDSLLAKPREASNAEGADSPVVTAQWSTDKDQRNKREYSNRPPSHRCKPQQSGRMLLPTARMAPAGGPSTSQLDITALPSMSEPTDDDEFHAYIHTKPSRSAQRAAKYATELYTISYLVFFAIFGTLARLGLQALTFYPGAPIIFSELWANVAGTFVMGFLAEDRRLFRAEWGSKGVRSPEPSPRPSEPDAADLLRDRARHVKIKKTIPLYIGLATGFCGSFTSFSSFMRDIFLSLSKDLKSPTDHPYSSSESTPFVSTTVAPSGGYSFMAIAATIIITLATCHAALKAGAHASLALGPIVPSLPFRFTRRVVDPVFVVIGFGSWLGAILMAIFPPHNAWRGQALFACVLAPVGCLARYYVSSLVNPILPSFPLGTFSVNVFGTAVLGVAYDFQHVSLSSTGAVGGGIVSCQVLQGIMDGFCGALTTVSTWTLEIDALKRRQAYTYGAISVASGMCLVVIIMGSVRWTVRWDAAICVT